MATDLGKVMAGTDLGSTKTGPSSKLSQAQSALAQSQNAVQTAQNPYGAVGEALGNFSEGVAKGELNTLKGAGTLGQTILNQTAGRVANLFSGKGFTPTQGGLNLGAQTQEQAQAPDMFTAGSQPAVEAGKLIQPQGTAQKLGFGTEKVAEALAVPTAKAGILGNAAQSALISGTQGGIQSLGEGDAYGTATKKGAISGAISGITTGVVGGIGNLIGKVGDKIQLGVLKPSKADIEDGFNLNTIKEYDLGGSLNEVRNKTQARLNDISSQLNTKLASSPERVDMNDVFNQTVQELTDSSKLKGFGANTQIATNLEKLKNEINIVNSEGGLSIPDAQVIKQAAGGFGAWQYGKPDPDSKATEIVFNTFYNKLKGAIEQNSPEGVKELNGELSKLIPVMNAVIRRIPVSERANIISLNEMIGLVGSAMNPMALGPTLLALISRSGTAGNALSKASQPIENAAGAIGKATAPVAEQVLNIDQ